MGFYEAAGHWLTYLLAGIGIVYILVFTIVTLIRSWKRALAIGYTKKQLMTVVKSTVSFTIVPAIGILAGFFTIAGIIGIPLSWFRLSVIGSTIYEITAAEMSLAATGMTIENATAREFVLVVYVMAIGIMGGMVVSPMISKRIQKGTLNLKAKDPHWGALGNSVFMLLIIIVFVVPMLLGGGVKCITLLSSMLITFLMVLIIKKTGAKWLEDFIIVFSVVASMALSVVWTNILG